MKNKYNEGDIVYVIDNSCEFSDPIVKVKIFNVELSEDGYYFYIL